MQKLPIVNDNGEVLEVMTYPGDEQPDVLVIEKKFYTRDPAGFYRSATAYVSLKKSFYQKDGTINPIG